MSAAVDPKDYPLYEEKTIATYNSIAKKWAIAHEVVDDWEHELKLLKAKFLTSGEVIDIGCGSGRDIKILSRLGYKCVGVDASKGLLEIAKKNAPEAEFKLLNIYNLNQLDKKFDGFIAMASLLHIPRPKINIALEQIKTVLKPGAVGFITIKDGKDELFEIRDVDNRHEERLFTFWNKAEFKSVLETNGFEVIDYSYRTIGRSNWHGFYVKVNK